MNYTRFLLNNRKILLFGLLLTLFSSFGQTFIISLYLPQMSEALNISEGDLGYLYALATIVSAATLVFVGRKIDSSDLQKYTLLAIAGMCVSLFVISRAQDIIILVIGLAGLRLTGQGLLGHISSTSMLRFFDRTKGKALSITSLGYPVGQAAFPAFVLFEISEVGWRDSLVINLLIISVFLIPVAWIILKDSSVKEGAENGATQTIKDEWTQIDVLKQKSFYKLLPGILIVPFLVTALFFYQLLIAEKKGWSADWIAFSYIGFATGNFLFLILSGPVVDRLTAKKVFPFYLIPFCAGIALITVSSHPLACFVYMTCIGVSTGMSSIIKSTILAEVYGVKSIGAVKSLFTTSLVVSSALGPLVFGALINKGVSVNTILLLSAGLSAAVFLYTYLVYGGVLRKLKAIRIFP